MKSRRRAFFLIIALIVGSSIVSLVIGEFVLRTVAPHLLLSTAERPTLRLDDALGWTPIDPMLHIGSDSATFHIHFMGDSFTDFDDRWPKYLIENLAEQGITARGTIGGAAGFGTYQEYVKLKDDLKSVSPNLIVLLVFLWNDLRDNAAYPPIYYNLSTSRRPYLLYENTGFHEAPPLPRPWYRHLAVTAAASRAAELAIIKGVRNVDSLAKRKSTIPFDYSHPFTWLPFYLPETYEYVENAWKVTEESLRRIQELATAAGSHLCVLGLDNAFTVDNDVWDAHVTDVRADRRIPLRRLDATAKKLGLTYFDLQPDLLKTQRALGRKIYNDPPGNLSGHLTDEGESIVASTALKCVTKGRIPSALRGSRPVQ